MMGGFQLQLRMMLRRMVSNGLIILLLIVTTLFLSLYPRLIDSAAEQVVEAGKGIEISGWAYHPEDDQYISFPLDIRDALMETGYIKRSFARGAVQYYALDAIIEKQGVGDTPEARREYILEKLDTIGFSITAADGNFYGVNDISADSDLLAMKDQITWLKGYDADCLSGTEAVCLYPAGRGVELGDEVEILLHKQLKNSRFDRDRLLAKFKVVGLFHWNAENPVAYCPLSVTEALLREREGFEYTLDRFVFTVGQNDKLMELKEFFAGNGLHEGENLRVAIDDRMYEKAMAPLEKNLELLQGLQYIFYILVVLLGFFLCFLVARRRKPEYAVMRLLGEPSGQVVRKALLEQLILCAVGVGAGSLLLLVSGLGAFSPIICGSVALCYGAGAALAVMLMVRVDVMEILRDRE